MTDPPLLPEPDAESASRDEEALQRTFVLVHRYQGGDEDALNELFSRYYARIRRIVRVRMSARLRAKTEADDIVNSVLAQAFKLFKGFEYREKASVINWLAKIAENKIRDKVDYFLNAEVRSPEREVAMEAMKRAGESSAAGFEPAAQDIDPAERVAADELNEQVDAGIATLQSDYREVILLRDYEAGSWRHVAQEMERSDGACQMLYVRAKLALAKVLRERGVLQSDT